MLRAFLERAEFLGGYGRGARRECLVAILVHGGNLLPGLRGLILGRSCSARRRLFVWGLSLLCRVHAV